MANRRKRQRVFHVNMLRKWYAPPATAYWVEEGAQDEMEVLVWNAGVGQGGQPTVVSN